VIGNKNVVGLNELALELDQILAVLGQGYVKSVAYDTAWVARLSDMYRGQGFDEALPWVRRHQHSDGSWGGDVLHYMIGLSAHSHRLLRCTLSVAARRMPSAYSRAWSFSGENICACVRMPTKQ